jgi:hypothetical protein
MDVLKRWAAWLRDNRRVVGLAATVIVGGLVIAWVLFVPVADWLATHDVGPVTGAVRTLRLQTARDAARGRLLTLGAGIFAVGALWFTARNFTLARRQVDLARQAMEVTERGQQRTLELTEQGQVTDRYTKAIEQLGSDKLNVRIGGIYALERVARDSSRDHPTVMEVLTAFVREHSREQWPEAEPGAEPSPQATRPDVQAAVTVIGRRNREHDQQRIDLAGVNLPGANLGHAYLGHAYLDHAKLVAADLSRADLTEADLTEADLTSAYLAFAKLTGADLSRADLTRAYFGGADLARANLTDAKLGRAGLSGANLTGANLAAADLTRAYLGATNLTSANLSYTNLADANLMYAKLDGANLEATVYPKYLPVPEGWVQDPDSGRLRRASEHTGEDDN